MSLENHVQLTITVDTLGVARATFAKILVLSHSAPFPERVRFYSSLVEVTADFPVTTSPEYLSAQAIFSQTPHPVQILIGNALLQPTQAFTLSINNVLDDQLYELTMAGEGFAKETVSFTSDSTATDGEIVLGLVAALNLVSGKNFTAAGATSPFTITGDAAADWFSVEGSPAFFDIEQDHADPGVATDLAAIKLVDDSWYGLHTFFNSNAYALAAAAFIETEKKIYVFDVNDTDAVNTTAGNSDTLDDIATATRERSAGVYHHAGDEMLSAGWMSRVLSKEPGESTWKFKRLSGVTPSTLTTTNRNNLIARNANFYEVVSGNNIMSEGTVADAGFIDTQVGTDWLDDDMSKAVFETLLSNEKIPFTDPGIAIIEGDMRGSLQRATTRTILAADPEFTIQVPKAAAVTTANKAIRTLPDMKFAGILAGAVHKVIITGVLSL